MSGCADRVRLIEKALARLPRGSPDECWPWPFGKTGLGYGQATVDGEILYVHRLMFELDHGHPPAGVVRHSCDNPPCANPAHLLDGTMQQNTHDMLRNMRMPNCKLDWTKAADIRVKYASGGISQRGLAAEYGVSQRLILRVLQGKSWPLEAAP